MVIKSQLKAHSAHKVFTQDIQTCIPIIDNHNSYDTIASNSYKKQLCLRQKSCLHSQDIFIIQLHLDLSLASGDNKDISSTVTQCKITKIISNKSSYQSQNPLFASQLYSQVSRPNQKFKIISLYVPCLFKLLAIALLTKFIWLNMVMQMT